MKTPRRRFSWRAALAILAGAWALYLGVLHPWIMRWGATDAEVAMRLPGDDPRSVPSDYFTRAITIRAPRSVVWSWIVQMGQDRAGFYSNDWLENLTTADIHNAAIIRADWQQRRLGDEVSLARPDLLFGLGAAVGRTTIVAFEQDSLIADIPGRFVLRSIDDGTTRLIVREPHRAQGSTISRWLAWDPAHFVMVQRMMRGIKERAEGTPVVSRPVSVLARAGWLVAAAVLMALFFSSRRWIPWIVVPGAFVVLILVKSNDWHAAIAGSMAIGITIVGALAFGRAWWASFLALAAIVLLTLLIAPDPYTAFGIGLGLSAVIAAIVAVRNVRPASLLRFG